MTELFSAIVDQTAEMKKNIPQEFYQGLEQLELYVLLQFYFKNHIVYNAASTLTSIHQFIFRKTAAHFIRRMFTYDEDKYNIRRFNIQLDEILAIFQVRTVLPILSTALPVT